jgi:hypothetical protein
MLGILCITACSKSSTALVTYIYIGNENMVDTEDMFTLAMTLARNCECVSQFDMKYCCVLTNTNMEDVHGFPSLTS